jgi:hypothetical protein
MSNLLNLAINHINQRIIDNPHGISDKFGTIIGVDGYLKPDVIGDKSIDASKIKTEQLIVGENVTLGLNAKITWANLDESLSSDIENNVHWLGSLDASPAEPKYHDGFYHTIDLKSYIWDGISWQVMGERGPQGEQGPQGPQGEPGEYYAPTWIKSTYIDFSQVQSPTIIANNATIIGKLIGGEIEGAHITEVSGTTTIFDLYKDEYGGRLFVYNNSGGLVSTMGVENGLGSNRNGTIVLFDGGSTLKRVELGILKDYGCGAVNVRGSNNLSRISAYGASNLGTDGVLSLFDDAQTENTRLRGAGTSFFKNSVAIGKTSASYPLDVSGSIYASGTVYSGGYALPSASSGTFTPSMCDIDQVILSGITYSKREGRYYKIGNLVFVKIEINCSGSSLTQIMLGITGLPYVPTYGGSLSVGMIANTTLPSTTAGVFALLGTNSNLIALPYTLENGTANYIGPNCTQINLSISGCYVI